MVFKTPKFVYEIENWILVIGTPILVIGAPKLVFQGPNWFLVLYEIDPPDVRFRLTSQFSCTQILIYLILFHRRSFSTKFWAGCSSSTHPTGTRFLTPPRSWSPGCYKLIRCNVIQLTKFYSILGSRQPRKSAGHRNL